MENIPWNDDAVVVRQHRDDRSERELVKSGSLREVLEWIEDCLQDRSGLTISLPDRRVPPFRYQPQAIPELIIASKKERELRRQIRRMHLDLI